MPDQNVDLCPGNADELEAHLGPSRPTRAATVAWCLVMAGLLVIGGLAVTQGPQFYWKQKAAYCLWQMERVRDREYKEQIEPVYRKMLKPGMSKTQDDRIRDYSSRLVYVKYEIDDNNPFDTPSWKKHSSGWMEAVDNMDPSDPAYSRYTGCMTHEGLQRLHTHDYSGNAYLREELKRRKGRILYQNTIDFIVQGDVEKLEAMLDYYNEQATVTGWGGGRTALHFYAACGDAQLIDVFDYYGADVNAQDAAGLYPLDYARAFANKPMVSSLKERKAKFHPEIPYGVMK